MKHYLQRKKDNAELSLFDAFDDFFRPAFFDEVNDLKTNIKETGKGYELAVEVPGYKKEEIKVSLENGYLTVSCARNNSEENKGEDRWLRKEISESCRQLNCSRGRSLSCAVVFETVILQGYLLIDYCYHGN